MFERATAKHLPIDEFTGPSVAHMAGNSVVLEQVEKEGRCFLEREDWNYSGERSFTLEEYMEARGIG